MLKCKKMISLAMAFMLFVSMLSIIPFGMKVVEGAGAEKTLFQYDFESDGNNNMIPYRTTDAGAPQYAWKDVFPNGTNWSGADPEGPFITKTIVDSRNEAEKVLLLQTKDSQGTTITNSRITTPRYDLSVGKTIVETEISYKNLSARDYVRMYFGYKGDKPDGFEGLSYLGMLALDGTGKLKFSANQLHYKQLYYKEGDGTYSPMHLYEGQWAKFTMVVEPTMDVTDIKPLVNYYVNGRKAYVKEAEGDYREQYYASAAPLNYNNISFELRGESASGVQCMFDNVKVWQAADPDYSLVKSENIQVYENIDVQFTNNMDIDTLTKSNITVTDSTGSAAAIKDIVKSYNNSKKATITFESELNAGETYTVTITDAKDICGNSLTKGVNFATAENLTQDETIAIILAEKNPLTLKEHIDRYASQLEIDLTQVNALQNPIKVYEGVVTNTYSTIEEFKNFFAKETEVSKIREDNSALLSYISDTNDILEIKTKPYYSLFSDNTEVQTSVLADLAVKQYNNYTSFIKVFEESVILNAIYKSASFNETGTILTANADIIGLDLTQYNTLTALQKGNVLKALAGIKFASFVSLKDRFEFEVIIQGGSDSTITETQNTLFDYNFESDGSNNMIPYKTTDTGAPQYAWRDVFPNGTNWSGADPEGPFITKTIADPRNGAEKVLLLQTKDSQGDIKTNSRITTPRYDLSIGKTVVETELSYNNLSARDYVRMYFGYKGDKPDGFEGLTYLGMLALDGTGKLKFSAGPWHYKQLYYKEDNGSYTPMHLYEGQWAKFTMVVEPTMDGTDIKPLMSYYVNGRKAYVNDAVGVYLDKYYTEKIPVNYKNISFELRGESASGVQCLFDNVKVYQVNGFDWGLAKNDSVLVDEGITINFSNNVDLDTVTDNSIIVKDSTNNIVPISQIRKNYSNQNSVSIVFKNNLEPVSSYIVNVSGVKDIIGNTSNKKVAFNTSEVENPQFIVSTPRFYLNSVVPDNEIVNLQSGLIKVESAYTNDTDLIVNTSLIIAVYKDSMLIDQTCVTGSVLPGTQNQPVSGEINVTIPQGETGYVLKAFIWEGDVSSLKPLSIAYPLIQ